MRHIGLTISEAGRRLLASFYLVIVVGPILIVSIVALIGFVMD